MKIVLHGRMLVSNLFNTPVVVGIAVDSSADGGAGGIQSGYTGDGPADPVAIRHRLWVPGGQGVSTASKARCCWPVMLATRLT